MRRGDLKKDRLLFFDKMMFCKVPQARFTGNLVKNPIAERQSSFRVRLLPECLFKHLCHKRCIQTGLLFRINLAKYGP